MAKIKWTHADINNKIMAASLEPAPPMMPMQGGTQPPQAPNNGQAVIRGLLDKAQSPKMVTE